MPTPLKLPQPVWRYYAVPTCSVIVDVELDGDDRVKTVEKVYSMDGKRLTWKECPEDRLDEIHEEINRGKIGPVDWVPLT